MPLRQIDACQHLSGRQSARKTVIPASSAPNPGVLAPGSRSQDRRGTDKRHSGALRRTKPVDEEGLSLFHHADPKEAGGHVRIRDFDERFTN